MSRAAKRAAPKGKSTRHSAVHIRPAIVRDVPTVLAMIRGLAKYEKLTHEVRATPARLRRDGFGKRRFFQVLICERGKAPVGFALYFFSYSTFLARPKLYLEDLFVVPEERGTGAGKALLRALAREALRNGCGGMDWLVLDWNAPAIRFYERLGAKLHRNWIPTRLFHLPLKKLAHGK
jgi:GNAT superfamily N-acetyltransferase